MRKALLIGLIVALVLILVGGAGVVYARVRGLGQANVKTIINLQSGDRIVQPFQNGPGGMMRGYGDDYGPGGMMGGDGYGYGPGGMMGGDGYGYGPGGMMRGFEIGRRAGIMRDYMISAFAKDIGLTIDQVNTRLANGETFKKIALSQGKTEADLPALAVQVRKDAIAQALADGVITQTQADRMLERMNNLNSQGFDFWNCPMWDGDELQP